MISSGSRYSDGRFGQVTDGHYKSPTTFVLRRFSGPVFNSYTMYSFSDADRIDNLGFIFFGYPQAWSLIMDINPEIADPFNIPAGTLIRIPNG
jgi:hypothetical protein